MKRLQRTLLYYGAGLMAGAFFSLLLMLRLGNSWRTWAIGYFYAICFLLSIWIVERFFVNKLSVFTSGQQWVLRTLLYTIALGMAYLIGLVFQMAMVLPLTTLQDILTEQVLKGVVNLLTLPFQRDTLSVPFNVDIRPFMIPFFGVLFLIGLVSVVGSYIQIRWQEKQQQTALQQAELTALRAQIEPHFLFNSLNTIASLISTEPRKAEHLVIQLSRLLRYLSQNARREKVPLNQELEFTRQYVELLEARFGERLQVEWQIQCSQPESVLTPVMLIQPLIENAILHGWKNAEKPLHITLQIEEGDDETWIAVEDNGCGIPEPLLKKLPRPGHALANINDRLEFTYGKKQLLTISSHPEKGTRVNIRIPRGKK
ncbi:MAG: hypothetical protein D6748_07985 [Calditrichaeota bacterium]|nr:MAG: hypothetical protein D6748_07985 [Calditrichota bacterium]